MFYHHYIAPPVTVEITPTGSPPIEGQTYSLTCAIRGIESQVTMAEYQWTKNGGNKASSPTLTFSPLTRSDDGTYTCTVTITLMIHSLKPVKRH